MSRTISAPATAAPRPAGDHITVNGRTYFHEGDGAYKHSLPPGREAPPEADVITGDKRKGRGWKIAWILLILPFILGAGCCGLTILVRGMA